MKTLLTRMAGTGAMLFASAPAWAADLIKAPTIEQQATMVDKGDTTWMLISSVPRICSAS